MNKSQHDIYMDKICDEAIGKIDKYTERIEEEFTQKLRAKYKGKKVKCKCFDVFLDGDEYYFDEKLIDIRAYIRDGEASIRVTFMYKSIFAGEGTKPKVTNFHLESIESVK